MDQHQRENPRGRVPHKSTYLYGPLPFTTSWGKEYLNFPERRDSSRQRLQDRRLNVSLPREKAIELRGSSDSDFEDSLDSLEDELGYFSVMIAIIRQLAVAKWSP